MLKNKKDANKVIELLKSRITEGEYLANTSVLAIFKNGSFWEHTRVGNDKLDAFLTKIEKWNAVNEEILKVYFQEDRFLEDYRNCTADFFSTYFSNKVVKARAEINKKNNYFKNIITELNLILTDKPQNTPSVKSTKLPKTTKSVKIRTPKSNQLPKSTIIRSLKPTEQHVLTDRDSDAPKVFISYSWDNEKHKQWVLTLAERLIQNHIWVILDRYDLRPGEDITHYIENAMSKADRVLIILTPNYKLKAEQREGGVGYEASIITANIFKEHLSNRFIPILRSGTSEKSVPVFLSTKIRINMKNNKKFEENLEELVREIHGKPVIKKPPLGEKPKFDE